MESSIIRVLVVDDSATVREIISDLITDAEGLEIVGTARDGAEALNKVRDLNPDIVTLDVQMPGMSGLETLEAILEYKPIPVIMVSALTSRAADVTLKALELGALDYLAKPESSPANSSRFRQELIRKLRTMAVTDVVSMLRIRRRRKATRHLPGKTDESGTTPGMVVYEDCCIALGISTGGPPALSELFQALRPPLPATAVVQHMPADFTGPFAARLNSLSQLSIKEAESGDVMRPNQVLVAPGGRQMQLKRRGARTVIRISDGPPVSGHRPSVDVMMESAADAYQRRCLGVIMTGMGHDGVAGCAAIGSRGGIVIGQDQASSDVYGMNKAAFVAGHVNSQVGLQKLPKFIANQCRKMFRQSTTSRS